MNAAMDSANNQDARLEAFAAELASAAYRVALRHGVVGTWIDLELDLWRALIETIRKRDGAARDDPASSDLPFVGRLVEDQYRLRSEAYKRNA
jgi:hypothetical protein